MNSYSVVCYFKKNIKYHRNWQRHWQMINNSFCFSSPLFLFMNIFLKMCVINLNSFSSTQNYKIDFIISKYFTRFEKCRKQYQSHCVIMFFNSFYWLLVMNLTRLIYSIRMLVDKFRFDKFLFTFNSILSIIWKVLLFFLHWRIIYHKF